MPIVITVPAAGRYWQVIEAAFGTAAPTDPPVTGRDTSTGYPTIVAGGWTRISGPDRSAAGGISQGGGVNDYNVTSTAKNLSTGKAEAGVGTIVLDGDDGWLDPTNPTSPYAGYLVPGVAIRAWVTDGNGHYWPDWRGFVRQWPMSQSSKPGQTAAIECYDAVGWLGGVTSPYPTEMHRAVLTSGPSSYWPHDEPSGATAIRDVVSGFDATLSGSASMGGPSLTAEGYGGSLVSSHLANGDYATASQRAFTASPTTYALLVRLLNPDALAGGAQHLLWSGVDPAVGLTDISIDTFGVSIGDATGNIGTQWNLSSTILTPGLYHLGLVYDGTTVWAYFNGAGLHVPCAYSPAPQTLQWGGFLTELPGGTPGDNSPGAQISHVAIWPRALSGPEMATIAAAAFTARSGDTAGARLGYLLDQVGWPASLRSIGSTMTTVGPVRMGSDWALDTVNRLVAYEDGILSATADGKIALVGRYGDPPSSFAVGGHDLTHNAPLANATYSTSEVQAVTAAVVGDPPTTYESGATITSGVTVTVDQKGVNADNDWLVAQRLVHLGVAARPGIDGVTLDPVDTPTALTLALAATGTVQRKPIWSPTPIVEPHQVTSINGTGGAGRPVQRTISLLRLRRKQWRLQCPSGTYPTVNGATTPNSAALAPANLVIECQFRLQDWTTSAILLQHGVSPQGWLFWWNAGANALEFGWFDSGGVSHHANSATFARFGTRYVWVAVNFIPASGAVNFFLSPTNRSRYVPWGLNSVGATTVAASTAPLILGQMFPTGGGGSVNADVLEARLGPLNAAATVSFDPTADNQPGVSSWTASTGETWSLQGTGSLIAS